MYPFEIKGIMENDNIRKITIRGHSNENFKKFALNEDATADTVQQLIRDIIPQTKVVFYDKDYPSRSDPGAYVSFMRMNDKYIIQHANHGWATKWMVIDAERLEGYLLKCSSSHKLGLSEAFEDMMIHYQVKSPAPDRVDWDKSWEEPKKKTKSNVFKRLLGIGRK